MENMECAHMQYRSFLPLGKDGDFTRRNGDFNIFDRKYCQFKTPYRRRDFYKITLIENKGLLHYAEKVIPVTPPTLLFSNPKIPYCWEAEPGVQQGFYCVFTAEFLTRNSAGGIIHPLFTQRQTRPVFQVDKTKRDQIADIFRQIEIEHQSDYREKEKLIFNYLQILIHEACKLNPVADRVQQPGNASARITALFMEMLDRQFPVDPAEGLQLKKAADYADSLSVHVNHLNRAIKEVTGKTTTGWITGRLITEAQKLLLHTDLNIGEIAYALGFEYPSYFNQFFRKMTDRTPADYRTSA